MTDPSTLIGLLAAVYDRTQSEERRKQRASKERFVDETSRALADHHAYAVSWSREIHANGPGQVSPGVDSVPMQFSSHRRSLGVRGDTLDEEDLLLAEGNFVVLGDPGAGKTTTLRRLASLVATGPEIGDNDLFRFVVVVVCREESWADSTLYEIVGKRLGLVGRVATELDNYDACVHELLGGGGLLIVDGLDEVASAHRTQLERDITRVGRSMDGGKVVVSCRSGDYVQPLPGLFTAEILPLSHQQVGEIVSQLLGTDADEFAHAVQSAEHPGYSLTDRPLFLVQMIKVYRRRGTVPDRPVDLYESIVRLVIEDWDAERGVQRRSRYASFEVDEKRRFLADLAFELSSADRFRFSLGDLARTYELIAERYELPRGQSRQVARELESHTGLLVESGDQYEFSHLSLQEYLAGEAMVRSVPSTHPAWWEYYEIAAVAVALASDPNGWVVELARLVPRDLGDDRALQGFLYRLGQERPRFTKGAGLGHALLSLMVTGHLRDPGSVQQLSTLAGVRRSIAEAVRSYETVRSRGSVVRAFNHGRSINDLTDIIEVDRSVLEQILGVDLLRECLTQLD